MQPHTPKPDAGEEPVYSRSVFEAILVGMDSADPSDAHYVCSEEGAWVQHRDSDGLLDWHPWSEVMTPGSPNPLDEPWLRFPFTARQLAALMTDGRGYFVQAKYGDWQDGPDEDELLCVRPLGGKAKEALRAAYAEYRRALEMAPRLDRSLELIASELEERHREAREAAKAREELHEHRDSDDEYKARLARVEESVVDLKRERDEARQKADLAYSHWRRSVVQHLLLPIEEVSAECFDCSMLRALPPDRRAEALHQTRALGAFKDSEEGKAHWELICEQDSVEAELRRWQLMQPQGVTEAVLHEAKLKELTAKLTAIADRMRSLESEPPNLAGEQQGRAAAHVDYARLASRDQLMAAFGSFGLKRSWFDDLKSRRWLLQARKVLGQGQRGSRREPLYCPFETMTGLVAKSRKSRLSTDAGWRILENKFPAVYAAVSVGDPREPSG